jgi:hypothetical protein
MFITAREVTPIFLPMTRSPASSRRAEHALLHLVGIGDGDALVPCRQRVDDRRSASAW